MTLYEFNLLSGKEKEVVVFEQSEFLYAHTVDNVSQGLYAKDKFFVEVICYADSLNVIEMNSFKTGYLLAKYSEYLSALRY